MTPASPPVVIDARRSGKDVGLGELWRYRSIPLVLARRNLKARYRQTLVGVAWVLIQPLVLMIVFSIFFGLIDRGERYGLPYPVFFLCALAIWQPALKILNEGTMSIITNPHLVTRVYLPRAFLPLSVALTTLVDLVFTLAALAVILIQFGYSPLTPTALVVPLLVAIAYATAIGLAFFLSAVNTAWRDVQVMLPFLAQVWFFSSPLLYPADLVPVEFQPLYYLNPMALVFTGSRWALAGGPAPPLYAWPMAVAVSIAVLVAGYLFFHRREPTFSDLL